MSLGGDEDLENRVPWDRSVGIDTLKAVVPGWTDDEAVIGLDESILCIEERGVAPAG